MRRGIILAGGSGSRLYPITAAVSKQLLPLYDKPMIYYPLSVLMLSGIQEILIITTPGDRHLFEVLLGDGQALGLRLNYAVQPRPEGIAQAFVIAEAFLKGDPSALILGDNLFYGGTFIECVRQEVGREEGATLFTTRVQEPARYGVVEFGEDGQPISLEEKPPQARSPWAITGLYLLDGQAPTLAHNLKPSQRGELEITDLARLYLERGNLRVKRLGRGVAWLDTGDADSLLSASTLIQTLDHRQGLKVACIEEIAWRQGWISSPDLARLGQRWSASPYGRYLLRLAREEDPHETVHRSGPPPPRPDR